jgi:hypothetical protein
MGIFDAIFGDEENDELSAEYMRKAASQFDGLTPPQIEALKLAQYENTGDYNPTQFMQAREVQAPMRLTSEQASQERLEGTAQDDIAIDLRLKDAQLRALGKLSEIAQNGGMSAQEKAELSRIQNDAATADRGRRESILTNMAARGQSGSGNDLLAQLQSSQAATDRQAQQGLDVAGMAQSRALQALQQQGQMAGSIRGQEYGEQSDAARARDAIQQFNAQNSNQLSQFNVGQRTGANQFNVDMGMRAQLANQGAANQAQSQNVDAANKAGMYNAGNRQTLANANVDMANKQQQFNNNISQQMFDNETELKKTKAAALGGQSQFYANQSNRTAQTKAGLLEGAVQLGGVAMLASDENCKKNISSFSAADVDAFLSSLKPKKFEYKNPSAANQLPGKRAGFIAQDIQKSKLGNEAVIKDTNGLKYDAANMQGIELAAIKHLSDKVDRLKGRKS